MSRRAGRRDRNHGEIRQALRDVGCSVLDLGNVGEGCLDLLVATPRGRTFLLEVKDGTKPPSARKLTPDQEKFIAEWKGETAVALSRREALAVASGGEGITYSTYCPCGSSGKCESFDHKRAGLWGRAL